MAIRAVDPHSAPVAARAAAERAAASAAVELSELHELEQLEAAAKVLSQTWSRQVEDAPVKVDVLRALAHAGNYVAGASRNAELIGVSVGFLGQSDGHIHLHSHITGVLPGVDGRGVGFALKQHQRWWALAHGIERISWTFDPLVRRNAYFNLVKLGADIVSYLPRFYGEMHDAFNAGDETDRALVEWNLGSPVTVEAAGGRFLDLDADELRRGDAEVILRADERGGPVSTPVNGSALALAWIPEDVVAIRRSDSGLALDWRYAFRESVGAAIGDGFVAGAMTRSGWYVLRQQGATLPPNRGGHQ